MEEQDPSAEYIKAFNNGYLLAKYMPELSEELSKATGKSVRLEALKSGREQYLIEVEKEQSVDKDNTDYPKWLQSNRLDDLDKDLDKQKDLDNEPDI